MQLTFANDEPPDITIFADGSRCGTIDAPSVAFPGWRIRLMVTGPDFKNAPYHWLNEHAAMGSLESMWPALQRHYEIWRES